MFANPSDAPALNIPLLNHLRGAPGRYLGLRDLGDDIVRVQRELDALERFGFQIERHPFLGASYRGPAARLCPDQIEHGLKTRRIGRRIAVWNRVGSTNDLAARAGSNPANDGLVVLAEEQMSGRGRRGRRWIAPAGSSILMSILLFPPMHLVPLGPEAARGSAWLTALAAVAVAETVSERTGAEARIKWPNDVRVAGRKIAGILVERALPPPSSGHDGGERGARPRGVVIGIGLNVRLDLDAFPSGLRGQVTALEPLDQSAAVDRSELARDLIIRIDEGYESVLRNRFESLSEVWEARSEHLGGMVRVDTPEGRLRGRLVGLDLKRGLTLELGAAETSENQTRQVALESVLSLEE